MYNLESAGSQLLSSIISYNIYTDSCNLLLTFSIVCIILIVQVPWVVESVTHIICVAYPYFILIFLYPSLTSSAVGTFCAMLINSLSFSMIVSPLISLTFHATSILSTCSLGMSAACGVIDFLYIWLFPINLFLATLISNSVWGGAHLFSIKISLISLLSSASSSGC